MFCKKGALEILQNLEENTSAFFDMIKLQTSRLPLYWKADSGTGVYTCEFCEISKNTVSPFPGNIFFWGTASGYFNTYSNVLYALKLCFSLNHSFPMHLFSTFWKHQKTLGFLMFSGNREKVHWEKISWSARLCLEDLVTVV